MTYPTGEQTAEGEFDRIWKFMPGESKKRWIIQCLFQHKNQEASNSISCEQIKKKNRKAASLTCRV